MFILNTTFAVNRPHINNWQKFVHQIFIPALESHGLKNIKLLEVVSLEKDSVPSFALQCEAIELVTIHQWLTSGKIEQDEKLSRLFGQNVLTFCTILKTLS